MQTRIGLAGWKVFHWRAYSLAHHMLSAVTMQPQLVNVKIEENISYEEEWDMALFQLFPSS